MHQRAIEILLHDFRLQAISFGVVLLLYFARKNTLLCFFSSHFIDLYQSCQHVFRPEPDDSQRQKDEARLREGLKAMPLRQQS